NSRRYFTGSCQGAVNRNGTIVYVNGKHNHVLWGGRIGTAKVITIVRENISNTNDNPQQIFGEDTGGIPVFKRLCHHFQQWIQKWTNPAPSLSKLIIDGPYSKTSSGKDFFLFDSGAGDPNRILLSSAKRNLEVLSSSDHCFCDSTFKVAPPIFTQLMTIPAIRFDAVILVVYILLPNKINTTYKRVLEQPKNLKSDLKPATVMTDFEAALYGTFAEMFDGIELLIYWQIIMILVFQTLV
ncbi:hypothetical protein ILUMI_10570, partial [Ignelater luminosus]